MAGRIVGQVMDNARHLRDRGLSQRAIIALTVIAEGCREPTREGHVARARIASVLGATERTASRALHELIQAGVVVRVEPPRRAGSFDPVTGKPVEKGIATLYRIVPVEGLCEAQPPDQSLDSEDTQESSQSELGATDSEAGATESIESGDKSDTSGGLSGVSLPLGSSRIDSGGSCAHAGDAPSRYCSEHPDGTDRPCGGCASARRRYEAWVRRRADEMAAAKVAARLEAVDARRRRIEACTMCDDRGYRTGGVCSHDISQDEVNRRGVARVRAALAQQRILAGSSTGVIA